MPRFRDTGDFKGFAFIEFKTEEQAERAWKELNEYDAEKNPTGLRVLPKSKWDEMKKMYKKLKNDEQTQVFVPQPGSVIQIWPLCKSTHWRSILHSFRFVSAVKYVDFTPFVYREQLEIKPNISTPRRKRIKNNNPLDVCDAYAYIQMQDELSARKAFNAFNTQESRSTTHDSSNSCLTVDGALVQNMKILQSDDHEKYLESVKKLGILNLPLQTTFTENSRDGPNNENAHCNKKLRNNDGSMGKFEDDHPCDRKEDELVRKKKKKHKKLKEERKSAKMKKLKKSKVKTEKEKMVAQENVRSSTNSNTTFDTNSEVSSKTTEVTSGDKENRKKRLIAESNETVESVEAPAKRRKREK